jgi:hypothetical protein
LEVVRLQVAAICLFCLEFGYPMKKSANSHLSSEELTASLLTKPAVVPAFIIPD